MPKSARSSRCIEQDRLGDAEQRARALLPLYPNTGMLWKILGVALLRQGKDALPALRNAAELMPHDAEAHRNLGAALHDQEQWAEALVSLRRSLAIEPEDAQTLIDAADALKALGRAREAVPLYQKALCRAIRIWLRHRTIWETRSWSSGNLRTPLAVIGLPSRSLRIVGNCTAIWATH